MKVIFFGTPDFAVPTLAALINAPTVEVTAVVTQPDRPAGRGGKVSMSPVKELALAHSIPVLQPQSVRKEWDSFREQMARLGPVDIGVVIAFGQILPQQALDLPAHGCVNLHASLLPRWRGAAPIQRAIQAGDSFTGISMMRMDQGLDTGSVYSEFTTPIEPNDTGGSLHDRLSMLGAQQIVDTLKQITEGRLHPAPQAEQGITYADKIKTDECKIDWTQDAQQLARSIRAFSPWPGSFTFWRDKRLKILFAKPSERAYLSTVTSDTVTPGTVAYARDQVIEIICGAGSVLRVTEIQLEGKRRMTADEFLRGAGLPEGEILR